LNRSRDRDPASTSRSRPEETGGPSRRQILIVEDNKADLYLIRESVSALLDADLHVVRDGEQAIRFFDAAESDPAAPCPDLILLDINLPKRSGREVVREMRLRPRSANALVVVVTSSDSERDRSLMAELGVSAYFRKPSEYASFMKLGALVKGLLGA